MWYLHKFLCNENKLYLLTIIYRGGRKKETRRIRKEEESRGGETSETWKGKTGKGETKKTKRRTTVERNGENKTRGTSKHAKEEWTWETGGWNKTAGRKDGRTVKGWQGSERYKS